MDLLTLSEIENLANEYRNALVSELQAIENYAAMQTNLEKIKSNLVASAYETGVIDGKNAEIRKAQEQSLLQSNRVFLDAERAVSEAAFQKAQAEIQRKYQESRIGLVKAWLYSQSAG